MSPKDKKLKKDSNPIVKARKEKKKTKIILFSFISIGVIIVGLLGYAIFQGTVLKNFRSVAVVDGRKIDNNYYEARVRLVRGYYIQQLNMLNSQYEIFADDPTNSEYLIQQMSQIYSTLENYDGIGEQVLNEVIDEEIIEIEADKMGISVSKSEVDKVIQDILNYYPGGTPTPQSTPTTYATPTLSREQKELLSYTPTPPEISEDLFSDLDDTADDSGNTEEDSGTEGKAGDATPAPTATEYASDLFEENFEKFISDYESIKVSEKYLRKYFKSILLRQKIQEDIINEVPLEQEQIWARHILVKTEAEAQEVLSRLANEENWADIAADVSLDTSNKNNGGDLGWFPKGVMVSAFEDAAFTLTTGQISDPVETDFGWHIIQLVGKETRPLEQNVFSNQQQQYFSEWFDEVKSEKVIDIRSIWKDVNPTEPRVEFTDS